MKKKIWINQTLMKKMKNSSYCPRQIKAIYLDKLFKSVPTLSMLKGLYFESQCLGHTAGKGKITDLPRLKNGAKSTEHQRIDGQVKEFHNVCNFKNIKILGSGIYLEYPIIENSERIYIQSGEVDFHGTIEDDNHGFIPEAMFDIKLTGNIHSQFGDYSWAYPYNMDHTQAYQYVDLWQKIFGVTLPFYYLVFDYKANHPEYKIFNKEVENIHKLELQQTLTSTIEKIENHYAAYGEDWDEFINPSHDNCKNCPLQSVCKGFNPVNRVSII